MSGSTSPDLGGGVFRFWKVALFVIFLLALWAVTYWLFPTSKPEPPQVRTSATGNITPWTPPMDPVPVPAAAPPQPRPPEPIAEAAPEPARRARPSAVWYASAAPIRPPAPAPAAPAAPTEPAEFKIAGMTANRAEVLPEPEYWLMPGDKIECTTLEPLNNPRTGTPFSAIVPVAVRGRVGNRVLLPAGSRVVGSIVTDMERGQDRIAAVLNHAEWPSRAGQGTPVIALRSTAADQMGSAGLTGNAGNDFWSRFLSVAAYAALDTVVQAGGAIGTSALNDSLRSSGTSVSVNTFPLQNAARTLSGREYDQQQQRQAPFSRPQGQPCTVFVQHPLDFRGVKGMIQ